MDLSIVIVSWNVKDLLEKCLASIFRETRGISFEVFVIDNGSKDGSQRMVAGKFPTVTLIKNTSNQGFSIANNQGIVKARGRYVLLLNPDTEVFRDTFANTINFMDKHPECGISGIHILNKDYTHQNSVRRFPGFLDQAAILLKFHLFYPHFKPVQRYVMKDFDYFVDEFGDPKGEKSFAEVDQVMGAYMMIRREVIKKIGVLDPRFFVWMEEVDFSKRAKDAGYKVYYTRDAEVMHHYGTAFAQMLSVKKQMIFARSLRLYFLKHKPLILLLAIVPISWLSVLFAWIIQIFKLKEKQNVTKSYVKNKKEYVN